MYKKFTIPRGIPKGYARKILLIMRLTTVILIASIVQVSATTYAQKVTYVQKNISLMKLFKEITNQTSYDILWDAGESNTAKLINANFRDASLQTVLDEALYGLPLAYEISDKTITIMEKPKSYLDKISEVFANIDVFGRIIDNEGNPLSGATITVKGTKRSVVTTYKGEFVLKDIDANSILVITYIGYINREVKARANMGNISLELVIENLEEVNVLSTGYQKLPKERATGSFTNIDNQLINRSVGANILDRLDGVTSGLIFNRGANAPNSSIEIRGRSTIFSDGSPLIIVDNFPYEGDLANINPNDIKDINILKDAAAASIWGARSGNGVIVITTKKGKLNSAPEISFNSNVNLIGKPDLNYTKQLSSEQFIDVENFLFKQGTYDNLINTGYLPLSPAVEIFLAKRNGSITEQDSLAQINQLKSYDSREQALKYGYRGVGINQQYSANVSGGGQTQKYFVSGGYDKNIGSLYNSNYDRITLRGNNSYYFFNNKLELSSGMTYTASRNKVGGTSVANSPYPYSQVADADGNPVAVANDLKLSYAQTAGNGKLLNWVYKPLEEQNNGYGSQKDNLIDYRIDLNLNYKIVKQLIASLFYSYGKSFAETNTLFELESYYTRNQINQLAQIDPITGSVFNPLPVGAILNLSQSNLRSHNGRFQLNYSNAWRKHTINLLAGTEIRNNVALTNQQGVYGYDSDISSNMDNSINHSIDYPLFVNPGITSRIGAISAQNGTTNRFLSYYFNGSYSYAGRYIFSGSARKDESNIFGVATNQKGVPLWSVGGAWIIDQEEFYNLSWIPSLKLRATFGYTGNVNGNISALLTARAIGANVFNENSAQIINPPNPSLRWEKIRNTNFGFDFGFKQNRLSGSFDYWTKKGLDLIGNSPIAAQTGVGQFYGNSANTFTKGIDILINTVNINSAIKWRTSLLYSHNHNKVTEYKVANGSNINVVSGNYLNPLEGYPYNSLFSFKYAGLDASGNPKGYLNGEVSTNYTGISNSQNRDDLVFSGSAVPTHFGSIRNSLAYKNFDLSVNVTFKFNYFFRRGSLLNAELYSGGTSYKMADYENRWMKAGDENITNVPSLIYPADNSRDNLYTYSDILIEKADHIRLQDVRLAFRFEKSHWLPFRDINLFAYVRNLGIIWRANKSNLDPDYPANLGSPTPRTIAVGFTANF